MCYVSHQAWRCQYLKEANIFLRWNLWLQFIEAPEWLNNKLILGLNCRVFPASTLRHQLQQWEVHPEPTLISISSSVLIRATAKEITEKISVEFMLLDLWKKTSRVAEQEQAFCSTWLNSIFYMPRGYWEGRTGGVQDTSVCCRHKKVNGEWGPGCSLSGNQQVFTPLLLFLCQNSTPTCKIPVLARRKGLALPGILFTLFN